jgi:hypothetical protein
MAPTEVVEQHESSNERDHLGTMKRPYPLIDERSCRCSSIFVVISLVYLAGSTRNQDAALCSASCALGAVTIPRCSVFLRMISTRHWSLVGRLRARWGSGPRGLPRVRALLCDGGEIARLLNQSGDLGTVPITMIRI